MTDDHRNKQADQARQPNTLTRMADDRNPKEANNDDTRSPSPPTVSRERGD